MGVDRAYLRPRDTGSPRRTLAVSLDDVVTRRDLDALVVPMDVSLEYATGVTALALRAAGDAVVQSIATRTPAPGLGDVIAVQGGSLSARHLFIAAVLGAPEEEPSDEDAPSASPAAPAWRPGTLLADVTLARAITTSLAQADARECRSLGFATLAPASTLYPPEAFASVALEAVCAYFVAHPASRVTRVEFVVADPRESRALADELERLVVEHPERVEESAVADAAPPQGAAWTGLGR